VLSVKRTARSRHTRAGARGDGPILSPNFEESLRETRDLTHENMSRRMGRTPNVLRAMQLWKPIRVLGRLEHSQPDLSGVGPIAPIALGGIVGDCFRVKLTSPADRRILCALDASPHLGRS